MTSSPFDETWFHAPLRALGDKAVLDDDEARHLRKVLRVPAGTPVTATNGEGRVFRCATRDAGGEVEIEALELLLENPEPPRLHAVLCLLKGKDTEEPVEGLCQLDLAAVHLVTSDHTQEFKGQDHTRLVQRLEQKSLVALKQAKKAWLTAIHPPMPLRTWAESHPGTLVLLHPGPDTVADDGSGPLHLLTGPEGGFSPAELEWLRALPGCGNLGLGSTRIRATHAPLLACGKLMGLGLPRSR